MRVDQERRAALPQGGVEQPLVICRSLRSARTRPRAARGAYPRVFGQVARGGSDRTSKATCCVTVTIKNQLTGFEGLQRRGETPDNLIFFARPCYYGIISDAWIARREQDGTLEAGEVTSLPGTLEHCISTTHFQKLVFTSCPQRSEGRVLGRGLGE
ncbi:uncharacterized protein EI97DRAFT_485273 [Westerdykella ornata]|uniref:Uncharacterized protein n=1 Tax=Westerdykella ornata TaxID=318751 RepID=A0A6A6JAE6_WESOR|nr:uncharacterized protein EI97DRAFT_485273 [Westerdykella ornata]KAF2272169.1 hypothetical protein EI97DRAFT_485273 [Westerdykella ornata]